MDTLRARRWMALPFAAALPLGACGDDDDDTQADDDIEEVAESAGARVVAEALRTVLVSEELEDDQHARDVAVLEESVDDLPGDPEVSGIADSDGDGQDDDGQVEVWVGEEVACLRIAENDEVDVSGGAC